MTSHAVISHYLQWAGHTVTLFPAAMARLHAPVVELARGQRFVDQSDEGVRFRFVRTPRYRGSIGRLWNMFCYGRNVRRVVEDLPRPDVVIGSLPHPFAVEAAHGLARRHGACFVYEIRDIWPQSAIDLGSLRPRNPVCRHFARLERRAFGRADAVIGVLPGIAEYAARFDVPPSRIAYIPNGVDPALFPEPTEPPPEEPFVVSCFGRFGSANDMETIVEAAARLAADPRGRNLHIRLVGDGPSRRRLEALAARRGLGNLEFHDQVTKPELVRMAAQSHAFVHAHRKMEVVRLYGMSVNKVFSFLAAGRPVVFACQSPYDPIRQAEAGLSIPSEDPAAMAEAMIRLAQTPPEERAAMGRRGRQFVLEHHDLAKIARRLETFLEGILAAR